MKCFCLLWRATAAVSQLLLLFCNALFCPLVGFAFKYVNLPRVQANFIGDPIYNKWANNMALNSSYLTRWTYAMVNVYFLLSVIAMMRAQEGRVRQVMWKSQMLAF